MTNAAVFAFDPFAEHTLDDPYPEYEVLRQRFPVYRNDQRDFWALSRHDDVQAAARDWQTYSSAKGVDLDNTGVELIGDGNFNQLDPPRHTLLRDLVRRDFTAQRLLRFEDEVRTDTRALLADVLGDNRADLARELAWRLPVGLVARLLGFPLEDRHDLGDLFRVAFTRYAGDTGISTTARAAAAELRAYFAAQLEDRRRNPREDLITRIANAEIDGAPLGDDGIGICFLLFVAGTDTTGSLTSNALLLLARHPEERAKLVADPALIPTAIEECLRFEAPIQNSLRTTLKPATVHGVTIPAGERVVLFWGAANRDPSRWEDPDRFDVSRKPQRHQSFGEGIHFCLGSVLARLEARVVLEELLPLIPEYQVDGEVVRSRRVNERGLVSLPVVFDSRDAARS